MIIHFTSVDSPLGRLYMGQNSEGLCVLTLGAMAREELITYIEQNYPQADIKESKHMFKDVIIQLYHYFRGERTEFELPLNLKGTDFQKQVWQGLLEIPYGTTISYGELAEKLKIPGGMRAVGAANGKNPIPIIIPCHRVIAADGSLGGYTGGLDIKRKLLDLEQQKFTPSLF